MSHLIVDILYNNSISTDEACLNAWLTEVKTQFILVLPYQNILYIIYSI